MRYVIIQTIDGPAVKLFRDIEKGDVVKLTTGNVKVVGEATFHSAFVDYFITVENMTIEETLSEMVCEKFVCPTTLKVKEKQIYLDHLRMKREFSVIQLPR